MFKLISLIGISLVFNCLNAQTLEKQNLNLVNQLDSLETQQIGSKSLVSADKKGAVPEGEAMKISLFPNPSNENITIQFSETVREVQISIFNYSGQHCKTIMVNQVEQFSIDHGLESGLYVMILKGSIKTQAMRFKVN